MKASELREFNLDELRRKEDELRAEFLDLRFKAVKGELKNPLKLRDVRRDIARILTVVREKSESKS